MHVSAYPPEVEWGDRDITRWWRNAERRLRDISRLVSEQRAELATLKARSYDETTRHAHIDTAEKRLTELLPQVDKQREIRDNAAYLMLTLDKHTEHYIVSIAEQRERVNSLIESGHIAHREQEVLDAMNGTLERARHTHQQRMDAQTCLRHIRADKLDSTTMQTIEHETHLDALQDGTDTIIGALVIKRTHSSTQSPRVLPVYYCPAAEEHRDATVAIDCGSYRTHCLLSTLPEYCVPGVEWQGGSLIVRRNVRVYWQARHTVAGSYLLTPRVLIATDDLAFT